MAKNDCTKQALEGYSATVLSCPYLATSNAAFAWIVGRWLQRTGRSAPRDVRPSRGDLFHVNGMKVRLFREAGEWSVERIS